MNGTSKNTLTADWQWPKPTEPEPSLEEMMEWMMDIELPKATDGCIVEPDGVCVHGHPCWFLKLGLI